VVSKDGRTAYVTNFADGTISSYEIAEDGMIVLREAVAAMTIEGEPGIRDEALSGDGRYLYALHADSGQVFGWEVGTDRAHAPLGSANALLLTAAGSRRANRNGHLRAILRLATRGGAVR
jgi:6-phosphogluconolactonase